MEDLTNMNSSSVPEENAYDQSISSTPETTGTPETPSSDEGFSGFYGFGDISTERAVIGKDIDRFSGYVKNVTDLENRYENAAVNQGVFGALGNGLYRGVFGEIVGGTIQGFGALGNLMTNGEYSERNMLEELGNAIMEGANEDAQVFERNAGRTFAVGDAAWWAKNTPSMLSTLSMLIPGRAAAGVGSKVGRAVAKGASKVTKNAAKAERIVAKGDLLGDVAAGSVAMRHAENMREAHGSFEEARQEMMKTAKPLQEFKGTDAWKAFVRDNNRKPQNKFELADYVGGSAAKKTYQINSGNLAMDIIQMYGFAKALRGTRGALKGTAKAKAAGAEVSRYDRMLEGIQRTAKFAGTDMAGEGLEEMVNYVGTEEGLYYAKGLYTDREETTFQQRLGDYTNDDHFWESGFLGALGGGVFTGARAAAGYRATSKNQEELIQRAEQRGTKMQKLGEIEKLKAEGAPAEVVNNMRRRFAYDLGIEAAMSGQAEVAEMQLGMLEEQMRNDGATEAQITEAREEAAGQMKLAEQAVADANVAMKNHGLQGTEAAVFRKQIADNVFARQEIADIRSQLQAETKGVKNADGMAQSVERTMLADHKAAMEAKGDKATAADQIMLEILEERVAAHPEREGVMTEEAKAEAKAERKALMDKGAGARSEEENAKLKELDEAIKADSVARTEPKLNDNVALDSQLGIQDEFLEAMRSQMTTKEGIEGIREAASQIDKAQAKNEDKQFNEWLNKTTDQAELKSALKKEDNEARKEAIKSKLTDLENNVANDSAQAQQERSKDVKVPGHVQSRIDSLLENSNSMKLDKDGTYYVDPTGLKFQRTTTFMNGGQKTEIPSQWGIPSSNIGNSVDEYTRDFFSGELRGTEAYPALPAELQSALRTQLADLEARFVANGEKVIAKDVVLSMVMDTTDDATVGVAGTVDLLTVDKNGDFRVYDMKTIRRAAAAGKVGTTVNEAGDTVLEYGKKGKDLDGKHQKQLSAYRMMLMNQLGVNVPEIGIIAIDVNYDSPAGKTDEFYNAIQAKEANLLGIIPHEPLSELLGMTEPVAREEAQEEVVEEPVEDTIPEEAADEAPTADVVLPEGTVSLPLDALVPYFAQRLQVISEPSRGLPYLVHGHEGAVQIGDSAQANAYALLMDAVSGKSNLPVTFEVTGTQTPGMTDVYKSDKARKSAGQELLENGSYRGSKGDSLVISVKVGGVTVGTLPTTTDIMEAAHKRGQANLRVADRTFGTDSRIGSARQHENLLMTEISQDAHLANALSMHNLRNAIYDASNNSDVTSTRRVGYKLNVTLSTGTTSFGQQAVGSLIVDTSMELTPENTGTDTSIRKHGIGLQLPSSKEGSMQIELTGDTGTTVAPYQQGETREGSVAKDSIARWNSGALFIPLEHNGDVLWVKAPSLTIEQLNSADELIPALIQMLETGDTDQIAEAQNILGSNAVREGKDGTWAIYPTNQNRNEGDKPLSVLRGGQWSTPLINIVPGMKFDIAVKTAGSQPSAFQSGNDMIIGSTQYANIQDFVAREIKLGYSPVTNPDGDVMGWTHPLAPAYPFNDSEKGKKFSNENTKATQLTVNAEVVPNQQPDTTKVSGKAALDALMEEQSAKTGGEVDMSWAPTEEFDPNMFLLDTSRAASSNNTEKASAEDMTVAEEWWAANMPNVPFKRVKGIIKRNGRLGYGIFEKGAVQVSDLAVQGTEYHEAFHAVMHMFLDDTRRDKVLAEASKRFGTAKDSVETEERLAEEFREYMLTKGLSNREKNVVRRFFSELLELIQSLANGGFAAMRIYQGMNKGEFKSQDAKTKEYATRNKLIMDSIPEYDLNVQQELQTNMKTAAFAGLRAVQQGKGTPAMKEAYAELQRLSALSSKDIADETAGASRAEANSRQMLKLAMAVMSMQATQVMRHAPAENAVELGQRFKALFSTNRDAVLDYYSNRPEMQAFVSGLMDQEFTAGTNMDQQYSETFEKMNPKDSLSGTVRALIETTPMMPIDLYANNPAVKVLMAQAELALQENNMEQATRAIGQIQELVGKSATQTYFGMPQMMNVDRVFPYMSENLSSLATPAEMFSKLYDMGDVYPEFKLLAIRLQKEDAATQAQFFTAMRKGSTAELVLKRGKVQVSDVFTGALYNHNRQAMEVVMRDMAAQRGVTLGEMANGVAVGVAQIDHMSMSGPQFVKKAMQVLEAIGFSTMDAPAMERLITLRQNDHQFHENLFNAVQGAAAGFRGVANATEGQEERAEKVLNKNLNFLVRMFSPYDMGAVNTTFSNVEGKRIYAKQIPSYITEFFDQFEMNGRTMEQIEKDLREGMFRDPRMFATTYGRILFPQGIEGTISNRGIHQLKAYRVGGVDGMGGVTYTNMTEAQWYEMQIAAITNKTFVNGSGMNFLPITTPSDAGNSYMVPAMVYDTSTPFGETQAKSHLRETLKAEFAELQVRNGRFAIAKVDEFMRTKLVKDSQAAFYQVQETTLPEGILNEAVEIAYEALMAEGKGMAKLESFQTATASILSENQDAGVIANNLAVAGYLSNFSTSVAMAGTANEFKRKTGANTTDMQKRHKHIMSPGLAGAGVTGRQNFRSVTMEESVENLQAFNSALPAAYKNVEIADAQSYVSLDFYADILTEHGDMTPEIAAAIAKAKAGEKLDKAEVKLLRPYKPFYYTRVFNENTGLLESQQIKNSIIPVIKGISPEFDKFEAWMGANSIDQVQMNSAHKVGQTRKQVSMRDKDGNFAGTKVKETEVYTLPMSGYRKQVNVTDHWHNDSTNKLASQLEKIVVAAAVRNMGDEGAALAGRFLNTMDAIYKEQADKLFGQFEKEDGLVDKDALKNWLLSQVDDGSMPQYTLDLIEAGMFTAPAVINTVRGRLFTSVERDVNTIRVAGGTQVQVASQFYRNNENRLRGMRVENGVVKPAEIAVSRDFLPKQYREMSIEEIKAVAPEVLESITLRIPSESMNSGSVVEVVEFLPEGMDGVIVPDEFVTQMGSDFDVDKLFFQFKAGDGSKADTLFDLQVQVFKDQRNLQEIMAPQGFDTFSDASNKNPLRSAKQQQFINDNPYSAVTHGFLRADNMAGVALKGQAANKNVILLDLIRYGYEFAPGGWKVNGETVNFAASTVSPKLIMLHAEAVAAAMDGAKDPVYGKLGINNDNFGFFMEMLLMTDGDMDSAVSVIQSDPMQLLSNGDIQLTRSMDGKSNFVLPKTEKGNAFVTKINLETKQPSDSPLDGVRLPDNRNFFTNGQTGNKADMFTLAAIATWKNEVTRPLAYINGVMRSDKVQVAKGIEQQMLRRAPNEEVNLGKFVNPQTGEETAGADAPTLPVKREMASMFRRTANMLNKLGDAYLTTKMSESASKSGQGLTMQQYDAYGREQAAAQYARLGVYEAMGERDSKAPRALVEDRGAWSLENWLRHFRNSDEVKANPDLALVVSKMLVSTNPYNVRGTYYDNITLVGVSDDGELKQVTDAMDRMVASNDIDMLDFVEAIQAYEAQRSRYQMSQGRLTRILPTATQLQIATAAGAGGILDNTTGTDPILMIETDIYNPNVDFLGKTVEEGMLKAEMIGKAKVYKTGDGHVVFPVGEDSESGTLFWGAVPSPNAGQKFSGKHYKTEDVLGLQGTAESSADSRLMYTPELNADEKIQYLQERFRRVGMPVTVEFDSSLPVNGRVVFDKGTATIKLHPEMLQGDTVAHEFGHILVEALGYEHPLVQQAIGELKGSALYKQVKQSYPDLSARDLEMEVLVTFLGRRGTEMFEESKQQSKMKAIYNRIMRAIGKLFGIQPKATEQLAQELMFGDGELSLDARIEGFQDQRRTQTATETADIAAIQLRERIAYLKKTGGTSVDAKAALARAEQVYKGVNGGLVAERLSALDQAVTDVIADAGAVADTIDAASKGMRNSKNLTNGEAAIMRQAHNLLSELETLRVAMENMKPELMEDGVDMTEVQEAYKALQDKYDLLLEAHSNLTGAVRDGLSNKLKAQSSNKDLMDKVGADNLFDLAQNPRLRHLMTDVDGITKGTLGIKEFQNPVTQQIAKLVADTLETARLDGKDAEAQVGKIMREFEEAGGNIEDIIDFETGAFKGEYDSKYYQAREKARKSAMGKNKRALDIFDMENTEQQYTSEYYKNWTVRFGSISDMQEKVDRLQGLVKRMPNRTNLREELKEARKELLIELNKSAEAFEQFHNVEVLDGFAEAMAAAQKTVDDAVAARDAGEQVRGRDFFALQDFRALHGVIKLNGKSVPTTGQYASVSVKEQYNNEAWNGQPQPIGKWKNASFDANSLNGKTITALQAEMRKAAGAHGAEFVNNGFIPVYESIANKSAAEQATAKAKAAGKAAKDAATGMGTNEGYENEIAQDAMGGRIFIRNTQLFNPAGAEQLSQLKRDDMEKHLKQFVKDANIENAKRALEPIAYLTREAFNQSQIIDGQHVLKVGKKGEAMKAMKSARGSNIADALDQWFEGVLGDNWEDTTSMDSFAGVFQRYTSLMGVGLNVSAWVNNYGYGSLQRHLEFAGRDYFSKENSKRAHKLLHGALGDITRDLWSGREGEFTNKISAIVHTLDVADDQRELPFNMTEGFVDKAISKAFIGQTLGEIMMQNQPLLAMMMEQEVVLADGTRTNMLDAYELNDGVLSFPEGAKVVTAEGDVALDNAYLARFRNKVKSINHHIHGAYNKQDAGTWQRHWIGRLAMQFRRWLPMGIKKRYGKRMFNESREREEMGDYVAALEILKIFGQDAKKLGRMKEVLQGIKESDPLVYHNAMRAMKEVLVSMAAFGLLAAIYAFGIDDDDELGFAAAFALNRTERIGEEMRTYTPLGMYDFFLQTKKDPVATLSKAEDAMSFLRYGVHDAGAMVFGYDVARYESGRNSGQSKTARAAVGTLPILSHFRRLAELEDNTRTYSLVRGFIY